MRNKCESTYLQKVVEVYCEGWDNKFLHVHVEYPTCVAEGRDIAPLCKDCFFPCDHMICIMRCEQIRVSLKINTLVLFKCFHGQYWEERGDKLMHTVFHCSWKVFLLMLMYVHIREKVCIFCFPLLDLINDGLKKNEKTHCSSIYWDVFTEFLSHCVLWIAKHLFLLAATVRHLSLSSGYNFSRLLR